MKRDFDVLFRTIYLEQCYEYPSFGYDKQQYQTNSTIVSIWCSIWCSIR